MLLEQQKTDWRIFKVKPSGTMTAAQTMSGHHVSYTK